MKIHILSDLHLEFENFDIPETDADIIVLAGDICGGTDGLKWIISQTNKPVIYVFGNHEFYGHDIRLAENLEKERQSFAKLNIYLLNCNSIVINGVRFIGCTLWTDFSIYGETEKTFSRISAQSLMGDFNQITNGNKYFTPQDSILLHEKHSKWIEWLLKQKYKGKTVVVTHHAPSEMSVTEHYKSNILSPAFASNLNYLMGKPILWVHGHTHDSFDYEINGTRVVCNPRGYFGFKVNKDFDPGLVVEI